MHDISFSIDPLDPNFVPAKPRRSIDEHTIRELEQVGRLIITRKRDGHRHLIAKTPGRIRIYTRGIHDVTERFPQIAKAAEEIPAKHALFDGEIIVVDNDRDDIDELQRITAGTGRAAALLDSDSARVQLHLFDVLSLEKKDFAAEAYIHRFRWIRTLCEYVESESLEAVEWVRTSFDKAARLARRQHWEGLVLWDATKPTRYRLDGRSDLPPRPNGIWKWKPIQEDDFLVRVFSYGTRRNANRMGKLHLLQIDPETGEEIPCGAVGTGFTDAEREYFAHKAEYPLVVQVRYMDRHKSGKLRQPVFMRLRADKKPEECSLPESAL